MKKIIGHSLIYSALYRFTTQILVKVNGAWQQPVES